jgi:hypothetical protein
MDIKRTGPGQTNWKPAGETDAVKKADKPAVDASKDSAASQDLAKAAAAPTGPATRGPLHAVQSEFKRADLNTDRWNTILNRSVSAMVDSASERMGGLPPSARQKIAELLATDPIFSKRVSLYLDKNLE